MRGFLPVPWIRWQRFQVDGVVREQESGRPLPGLVVCAFDKDVLQDDYLGECETDASGRFEIRFTDADFKDATESRPDISLCVFSPGTRKPVHDTSLALRRNAGREEHFEIAIPRTSLPPTEG